MLFAPRDAPSDKKDVKSKGAMSKKENGKTDATGTRNTDEKVYDNY